MTLNMDDDDLDLSMRAPYISMSEADELPLLIAEDLMWGAQPEGLTIHKDIKQTIMKSANYQKNAQQLQAESNLAALLCNSLLNQQNQQMMCQQQIGENNNGNNNMENIGNNVNQGHHVVSPQPEIKVKIVDQGGGFEQIANGYKNGNLFNDKVG